jgi:uncharacterized protein (DUF427 family)
MPECSLTPRHPPTYYFPPDSIKVPLVTTARRTFCEVRSRSGFADPSGKALPRIILLN